MHGEYLFVRLIVLIVQCEGAGDVFALQVLDIPVVVGVVVLNVITGLEVLVGMVHERLDAFIPIFSTWRSAASCCSTEVISP